MHPAPEAATLRDLEELELGHLPRYKRGVVADASMGWAYYFPYLLTRRREGRESVLVTEDAGSLVLYEWTAGGPAGRLDLLLPPLPFDPDVLRRALERANDHNADRSARVMRIDEKDAERVRDLGLRVKQRRSQYLFAPSDYRDLGGRRLRTVRRQVAEFEAQGDVRIEPYAAEHEKACRRLLRRWKREHRAVHGTAGGAGTTTRTLELATRLGAPDLVGEVIFVDGELVSFAFGGEIRPGLACFLDAKTDTSVRGLSYAHRRSFLLALDAHDLVNDGSDTGRIGLRQLKESFRPVGMHAEFRASQRASRPIG